MADQLAHGGLGVRALGQTYARIYQTVQAQAGTLAYMDTFMVLCVGSGIMFFLSFILKKNEPAAEVESR